MTADLFSVDGRVACVTGASSGIGRAIATTLARAGAAVVGARHRRPAQQDMRPGQLWIQDGDGDIRPMSVRLGISDDSFTQVAGRNIAEGDLAVTRIRGARR